MNRFILLRFFFSWLLPFLTVITFIYISISEIDRLSIKNRNLNIAVDQLIEINKRNDTILFSKVGYFSDVDSLSRQDSLIALSTNSQSFPALDTSESSEISNDIGSTTPRDIFRKYRALYFGGSKSFDSLVYKEDSSCTRTIKLDIARLSISIDAKEIWGGDLSSSFEQSVVCKDYGAGRSSSSESLFWEPKSMSRRSDSIFIDYLRNDSGKKTSYIGKWLYTASFSGKITESAIVGKVTWIDFFDEKNVLTSNITLPVQLKIGR